MTTSDFAHVRVRNRGTRVLVQVFAQKLDRNQVESRTWIEIPGKDPEKRVEEWHNLSLPDVMGNVVEDWADVLLSAGGLVAINGHPVEFWESQQGVHAWAGLRGTRGLPTAAQALGELVRNIVRGELVEVE